MPFKCCIPDRLALQAVCEKVGIPMVHGAIAGLEGQVTTVMPGDPGLKKFYGDALPQGPSPESILGVPAVTPVMIAGLQVMEVVKLCLNRRGLSSGRMLYLDLEAPALETFTFQAS